MIVRNLLVIVLVGLIVAVVGAFTLALAVPIIVPSAHERNQ